MTAPRRPLDKERAYIFRLGEAAGLDPEQVRDLRNDLQEQGYPLMVIGAVMHYNEGMIREIMSAPKRVPGTERGGGLARLHGFMRGAAARQLSWLLDDLQELGHTA